MANKNTNASTGTTTGTASQAPGIYGTNIKAEDFIRGLPNFDPQLPKNEAGIASYFARLGITPDAMKPYIDAGESGLANLSSLANSKQTAGQESRVGNEAPASSQANPQPPGGAAAAAGGGQPAAGDAKPKKKSKGRVLQLTEKEVRAAGGLANAISKYSTAGGAKGAAFKSATIDRSSRGYKYTVEFYEPGEAAAGQAKPGGSVAAAPADAAAAEPAAEAKKPKGKKEKPAEPKKPISLQEQIANAKQAYVDRTSMPAPWYVDPVERVKRYGKGAAAAGAAALGATGLAAGTAAALRYAFGGGSPPPQQRIMDDAERMRRRQSYDRWTNPDVPLPSAAPTPAPQQAPQAAPAQGLEFPSAPAQPNPAGSPAPNQTTLMLERLLRSREYA